MIVTGCIKTKKARIKSPILKKNYMNNSVYNVKIKVIVSDTHFSYGMIWETER